MWLGYITIWAGVLERRGGLVVACWGYVWGGAIFSKPMGAYYNGFAPLDRNKHREGLQYVPDRRYTISRQNKKAVSDGVLVTLQKTNRTSERSTCRTVLTALYAGDNFSI